MWFGSTIVTDLWHFGSMGMDHFNPENKRSVYYHGAWISIQRVDRKYKYAKFRYYCHQGADQQAVQKLQEKWNFMLEQAIDQGKEYLMKNVQDSCYRYSEEFDTLEEAEDHADAHMRVFHPFSSRPLTQEYDLTPAWLSGSVLPRRKDIHHAKNSDADEGHPWLR